jgi:ABC-2 type transport system ATP-binding protein
MLHEVEMLCEQVSILKQGRVVASGAVADLLRRGRGVLVRVAGDAAAAADLLRGLAWISGVEQRGDTLLVAAPVERAAEITTFLSARSIPVAEIRAQEQRLEDFFLEVTGSADKIAS